MSVILICANEVEASDFPEWETVLVSDFRAVDGHRTAAAFATARARTHPDYPTMMSIVIGNVAKMVALTYSIPQVVMAGGVMPAELVRVA